MYFHSLRVSATLGAAQAGSEAVQAEIVRFAPVLPAPKPYYSSDGENILEPPQR